MRSICVFCGSKVGNDGQYRLAAEELGGLLAQQRLRLVYGGGSVGLMGVLADAVLACGGEVTGVIPEVLATKERLHTGVRDMRVVQSMHARKALMLELADALIALPGGYGTIEEFFEMITWAQLGLHDKPMGLLNVAGYFDAMIAFIDHAVREGFIKPKHRQILVAAREPLALLEQLAHHRPPAVSKWMTTDKT